MAHPGSTLIALGVCQGVTSSILILASLPSVVFLFPKWRGGGLQYSLCKISAADHSSHLGFYMHLLRLDSFFLHTYGRGPHAS
jgi:hypothetical protein